MPTADVKPTRSELLEIKKKIKLTKSGYKILKMKRDGLILEFFKILEQAKDIRDKVNHDYDEAMERIAVAKAVDGAIAVQSAAFALKTHPELSLRSKNIMGIVVPEIEASSIRTPMDKRGYGVIGTTVYIDEAAKAFENLVETIIEAAEIETTMKKILEEVEKTKRRVNALEFKVIPELTDLRRLIEYQRDEMERQDAVRLRRIKKIKAKRRW